MPSSTFSPAALAAALDHVHLRPGEHVDFAISGHDGGGAFEGELGKLSYKDLSRVIGARPALAKRVNAVELLGCYTATAPLVEYNWRRLFPNSVFVAGFWDRSPAGNRPKDWAIVTDLLEHSEDYEKDQTTRQFEGLLAHLKAFQSSLAVSTCDLYGPSGGRAQNLSQFIQSPAQCEKVLTESDLAYYQEVYDGRVAQPPRGKELASLRAYYGRLRNNAGCLASPAFLARHPGVPNPDNVIRLLLYPSLVENLRQVHAADFANLDKQLTALGFAAPDLFQQVDPLDRAQLLAWQRRVKSNLDSQAHQAGTQEVRAAIDGIYNTFVKTDPGCVSVMMLEGSPERSACINVRGGACP